MIDSEITMCLNAEQNECTLKETCKRYVGSSDKKYKFKKNYDYYANSCNGYYEIETADDIRARNAEEARERRKEIF